MSSILIKDMEMPQDCSKCPINHFEQDYFYPAIHRCGVTGR